MAASKNTRGRVHLCANRDSRLLPVPLRREQVQAAYAWRVCQIRTGYTPTLAISASDHTADYCVHAAGDILGYRQAFTVVRTRDKRNHGILLEQLGKNKTQVKVYRNILSDKRFRFKYHTHTHVNKAGKTFNYIYDLAWMEFSDDEILIVRSRQQY